jgi:hypothetical protein
MRMLHDALQQACQIHELKTLRRVSASGSLDPNRRHAIDSDKKCGIFRVCTPFRQYRVRAAGTCQNLPN